jgi:uncharacterized phage protein gp47/JayE
MPWTTPTLRETRTLTRDYVLSQLGAVAMIPNSVLRIMSDAMSGLAHLTMLYIDWLAKQLLPDTAETEWLDRHGIIWLKNADGSKGRKVATYAKGTVNMTGVAGTVVPVGTVLRSAAEVDYQTVREITLSSTETTAEIVALTAGTIGNLDTGDSMFVDGPEVVDGTATVVDIGGGTDSETDDELRARILERIQFPPHGGAAHDYVQWALAVPGVTRAWCGPLEMGIGTVTVRFMMDDFRADLDGFPVARDVAIVQAYIDSVRPVSVKDCFVVAPIPQFIDMTITKLSENTEAQRAAIEASVTDMLFRRASPGQTIYRSWVDEAITQVEAISDYHELIYDTQEMRSPGHMAVLGTIYYAE